MVISAVEKNKCRGGSRGVLEMYYSFEGGSQGGPN